MFLLFVTIGDFFRAYTPPPPRGRDVEQRRSTLYLLVWRAPFETSRLKIMVLW